MGKFLDILRFFFIGPIYALLIAIDRYVFSTWFFPRNPLIDFPRTCKEATTPASALFDLLKAKAPAAAFGADSTSSELIEFVSATHAAGADTEPDKQVLRSELTFRVRTAPSVSSSSSSTAAASTKEKKLVVFTKMPTARMWPIAHKFIMSTFCHFNKEVQWFALKAELTAVAKQVNEEKKRQKNNDNNCNTFESFPTPHLFWGTWSRAFDRSLLVFECIDMTRYHSRADHRNADVGIIQLMFREIAKLHALTYRPAAATAVGYPDPRVAAVVRKHLPGENKGMEWIAGAIEHYQSSALQSQKKMWSAIANYVAQLPTCVSHGDYRMGNMLFNHDFTETIACDWEANCNTFLLWDVAYAMLCSLSPEDRTKHLDALLVYYLDIMKSNITQLYGAAYAATLPSLETAREIVLVSTLACYFWATAMTAFGGVGETQNNSGEDMKSWGAKMGPAISEALLHPELARILGVEKEIVDQFNLDLHHKRVMIGGTK